MSNGLICNTVKFYPRALGFVLEVQNFVRRKRLRHRRSATQTCTITLERPKALEVQQAYGRIVPVHKNRNMEDKRSCLYFCCLVTMQIETLVNFLHQLLDLSGSIIKPYRDQSKLEVETKEDATPVTLADREAEQAIRELIHKHFPEHGIIGEEFGNTNEDAEFVWVLDPIDGTKSFITGAIVWNSNICLLKNGQPILGAIDQLHIESTHYWRRINNHS